MIIDSLSRDLLFDFCFLINFYAFTISFTGNYLKEYYK